MKTPLYQRPSIPAIGISLLLLAAVLIALAEQRPPEPLPAGAPPGQFSAMRAVAHLRVIARRPHPIGSADNLRVAHYLLRTLQSTGLEARIEQGRSVQNDLGTLLRAATVHNVVARLEGANSTKAVMIAAHYDSVVTGPGAADDGSGVATLLETARALRAGPALRNDVIFLFTDGEECNLMGARAFVANDPWAKEVAVALNFEARGTRGSTFMFETSDSNGMLIRDFAAAVPYPIANSLAHDVYRLMPNDTDFTIFRAAGMQGLNFAFIGGVVHYHNRTDDLKELDLGSLQHDGSYALALARRFGNQVLPPPRAPDVVYFDLFGKWLIVYPGAWNLPLVAAAAALFALVLVLGVWTGTVSFKGVAAAFVIFLLAVLGAATLVNGLWFAVRSLDPALAANTGRVYHPGWFQAGFSGIALATVCGIGLLFQLRGGRWNFAMGALLWWIVMMACSAFWLPGPGFFIWALLAALIGVGAGLTLDGGGETGTAAAAVIGAASLPTIVLFAPAIHALFKAMTLKPAGILVIPVAFATGLIWPALSVIAHRARWRLPGALTAASLVLVTAGMVANRTGDGQPHPDSIFYVLDGDRHRAMWASLDSAPDVWTRQFLGASAVRAPLPPLLRPFIPGSYLQAAAAVTALPPPQVAVVEDRMSGGVRDLKLRLNSVRGANTLLVYLDHAGLVESASIDGVALQPSGRLRGRADDMGAGALRRFASQGRWGLVYYAPERDLELTLHLRDGGGLRLYAADKSDGLPEALDIFGPRPAWLMPSPDPLGLIGRTRDAVIVAKSYYLPSGPGPQAGAR